jgi:uncharacterized protein YjiS (DUF1127 family)
VHDQLVRRPLYPNVARLEIRTWVWQALAGAGRTLGAWRRRRFERQRLTELDDHLLRDIGLTRGEALREVAKPFWQP